MATFSGHEMRALLLVASALSHAKAVYHPAYAVESEHGVRGTNGLAAAVLDHETDSS